MKYLSSLKFSQKFQNLILYFFTITILSHFLKDNFSQYYILLIFSFSLVFFVFLNESEFKKKYLNFNSTKILFIFFIISCAFITVISIIYMDRWGMSNKEILLSLGRFYICPLICIALYILINSENNLKNILVIYYFFIFLAALSIFIQDVYGHISFFGESFYWKVRYGKLGYSSITGSVNSYGVSFYTAIFAIFFISKLHFTYRSILISLIILAVISVSTKSGFINIFLIMLILFFYSLKVEKLKIFMLSIFIIFLGIITFDSMILTFASLIANTTGIEIIPNTIGIGDITKGENYQKEYYSFIELAIERISFRWWPDYLQSIDYYLGLGVYGGAGALATKSISTHNAYLDIYLIGGIPLIVSFLLLICNIQYIFLREIIKFQNSIILTLFWSNNIFLFNMIFYSGGFFHPVISFPFWVSIAYLMNSYKINNQ